MTTPLAWRNLIHNKFRSAVAAAGVAFSVLLIFMQLGFLGAVETSATAIFESLDFDVLINSPDYLHTADPGSFPRQRILQARSLPDVDQVVPLSIELNEWWNPKNGERRAILVIGLNPSDDVFQIKELESSTARLKRRDQVLVNRDSRKEFGPRNGIAYGDQDTGDTAELGRGRVEIAGNFSLETGLAVDGAVIVSSSGFLRAFRDVRQSVLALAWSTLWTSFPSMA